MNIQELKENAQRDLETVKTIKDLTGVYQKYLGKKGEIFFFLTELKNLPLEKRKNRGQEINQLKSWLERVFQDKEKQLKNEKYQQEILKENFDITQPSLKPAVGHLHPLTKVLWQVENIFQSLGFSIIDGPEIEDEYHNFDALNIPKDHPARDQWDTFWLKGHQKLLRTHTSPVQIRYMEKHYPPFRVIAPGKCFRHEATDSSHDVQFYQMEGLMIGRDISVANFKAVMEKFLSLLFHGKIKMRMRPGYFPFTEPSFEIDLQMKKNQWLEILGAGMVHPNVLKTVGYEPGDWQGFAFGMGIDRLAMLKYGIDDIRLFYNPDLRFIEQF